MRARRRRQIGAQDGTTDVRADDAGAGPPAAEPPAPFEPPAEPPAEVGTQTDVEPLYDEDGMLVPRPTMLEELIAMYPYAYATVSARLICLAVCGFPLVLHCAFIAIAVHEDSGEGAEARAAHDSWLRILCFARVIAGLPRPYSWWRIHTLHAEARKEPTQLRVAHRCLLAMRDGWVRVNHRLNEFFTAWLAALGAYLFYRHHFEYERSPFEVALARHALMCALFLAMQKALSVGAMLTLIHYGGADAELQKRALDRNSAVRTLSEAEADALEDDPCIICFSNFACGDRVRSLRCRHTFHVDCIDSWLLSGRPRGLMMTPPVACPVCSRVVDDAAYAEMKSEVDDPLVGREIAWLAEIRQRNFDAGAL